mgnify:FL=1
MNKYNNVRTKYAGRAFASRKEADHAATLDMLRKAKGKDKVEDVEYQCRLPLYVGGTLVTTYVADFVVTFVDGRREIHEVKGFRTDVYKIKKKLFEAIYKIKIIEF